MKPIIFLLVIIFSNDSPAVSLEGELIQGGMVTGQVPSGTSLSIDGKQIMITDNGYFAFGFGRDAAKTSELIILSKTTPDEIVQLKIKQRDYKIQRINGLPSDKVNPRTEQQRAKIKADGILVKQARNARSLKANFRQPFIWPAAGRISGVYGSQRVLNGEPRRPHFGIDIANKVGSTIIAPADGVVVLAEDDLYFSGGTIIVDHGGGIFSSFLHLSKLEVKLNQNIIQGEKIAQMGATGRVTGPHLDWRINWFNVRLDPALLVSGKPPEKLTKIQNNL